MKALKKIRSITLKKTSTQSLHLKNYPMYENDRVPEDELPYFGPYLKYETTNNNTFVGSIMTVTNTHQNKMTLIVVSADGAVKIHVSPILLYQYKNHLFWRYFLNVPLGIHGTIKYNYYFDNDPTVNYNI